MERPKLNAWDESVRGKGKLGLRPIYATEPVRTILFDKEAGLKMAVTALAGRYDEIRAGCPTGFNPLATEDGERGEAWLLDWFSSLLDSSGTRLTPQQSDELKRAIRQNANVPAALRNLRDFQTLLGDIGDGRDLAMRVGEWGPEGRYSWVFGPAAEPVVDFTTQDITAVDLTEILDLKTERMAMLAYLFRRIEMHVEEKRATLIVNDEAWKVLDDDYFSRKLAEWLVTARKKNVVVVMMTQFQSQIRQSPARSALEALSNQLLFPNPKADGRDYEDFRLTDGELGFVLSGEIGRRLVLYRSSRGSRVLDIDLSALGTLLAVLRGGRAGLAAFGDDYASRPKFWRKKSNEIKYTLHNNHYTIFCEYLTIIYKASSTGSTEIPVRPYSGLESRPQGMQPPATPAGRRSLRQLIADCQTALACRFCPESSRVIDAAPSSGPMHDHKQDKVSFRTWARR